MIGLLLVGTLGCLLGYLYLRWTSVRSYWAERNVPHLPAHPIWGSLTFLQRKNAGLWMKDMYFRFPAPYCGIWLFWKPALIVNDPEIGKRILIKDSDVFRDRFLGSGKSDPIGSRNLFTVNDPLWSSMRKRITPVFTSSKLRSLHGLLQEKCKKILQRIQRETKIGKLIEMREMYTDLSTDIIGAAFFGVDSDSLTTGKSHLREITKEFMKYNFFRGLAWTCIFFFPGLVDVFGFKMFPKKATDYFRNIFKAAVKQRSVEGSRSNDLMDVLLKIQRDAKETNEEMVDDTIIAQAVVFIQGGFDTSANLMTFATYELAYNQEAQDRLYNEILELKQRTGKEFHIDDLNDLTYMGCVINETLRKYPAMGFLDRIASTDYQVDENLTIPAGTPVYVNGIGMQWDPKLYPEPDKFKPERFLPENEMNIHPNTLLPFGDGPRNCIGQRFAYLNVRYAMAHIFWNYQVRSLPGTPKPNDCDIEKNGIFLTPSVPMSVEFVPRNKDLVF